MLHKIDHKPSPEPVLHSSNFICEVLDRLEYCSAGIEDREVTAFAQFSSKVAIILIDEGEVVPELDAIITY